MYFKKDMEKRRMIMQNAHLEEDGGAGWGDEVRNILDTDPYLNSLMPDDLTWTPGS